MPTVSVREAKECYPCGSTERFMSGSIGCPCW